MVLVLMWIITVSTWCLGGVAKLKILVLWHLNYDGPFEIVVLLPFRRIKWLWRHGKSTWIYYSIWRLIVDWDLMNMIKSLHWGKRSFCCFSSFGERSIMSTLLSFVMLHEHQLWLFVILKEPSGRHFWSIHGHQLFLWRTF